MKVLIGAGGTGGHIYPGLAIAEKIKKENPKSEIIFVGTKIGMEQDIIPDSGYPIEYIRAMGFERDRLISFDSIKAVFRMFAGYRDAKKLIDEVKPDIVIGTGGYLSGVLIYTAQRKNVPTLIHEQNAFPGMSNKLVARGADAVAISFTEAEKYFRDANTFLAGNPIREAFSNLDREKCRINQNVNPDQFLLLFMGGSQGAASINNASIEVMKSYQGNNKCKIIHISGRSQYEKMKNNMIQAGVNHSEASNICLIPYSNELPEILSATDLIVARSGAMTIAECAATATPGIFIPYPDAAENHQEFNAKVITDKDGGCIIQDKDLTGTVLIKQIKEYTSEKERLVKMGGNAYKAAIFNATDVIYSRILQIVDADRINR
jgi:UDP-N-acetylglucosamine--N-acetylmuramyl-(pentapeptide) pyrophosphoryl-undecaprenol N-acetylglucosamine transferase